MNRDIFFRFFANLPIAVRQEVVLDIAPVGPITWDIAYKEIRSESELGNRILAKLIELKFIPAE